MVRSHGLHGDTVIDLVSNRPERTQVGARFVTDRGELEVAAIQPYQGRWLVHFAGVQDRSEADALRGMLLRAPALAHDEDDDALWVHELVGSVVSRHDDGTALGTVVAVVSNPASDLLELDDGALVPVRFVVSHGAGHIEVDVPPGLGE